MAGVEPPMKHTIYLTGLPAEDTHRAQQDYQLSPLPEWQLEVLDVGAELPPALRAGQAILVLGCGGPPPGQSEAMWRLRLLACGCPWVAIARHPEKPTREMCHAAGAAYLTRPFTPSQLHELIRTTLIPEVGKPLARTLTCAWLLSAMAVLGANILLKLTDARGHIGFLALKDGKPFYSKVLHRSEGSAGLREILDWGKVQVVGQPLPSILKANLPDCPDEWDILFRPRSAQKKQGSLLGDAEVRDKVVASARTNQGFLLGGSEACDRVVNDLYDITACALVDLGSGQVVGRPGDGQPADEEATRFIDAASHLLRTPLSIVAANSAEELIEEVVILGRDGWYAASRLRGGAAALVVSATGRAHLGLARLAFEAAALELERPSDEAAREAEPQLAGRL